MPGLKLKRGIIPLFILIAVGIVFLAGGAYVVRQQFIKTGKSGKAALDVEKVKQQIANPTPLPSASPQAPKETVSGPITYTPPSPSPGSSPDPKVSSPPSFTITPPSGWLKGDTSGAIAVAFKAPEEDKDPSEQESGLTAFASATVTVQLQDLKGKVSLETLVAALKERAKGNFENAEYLSQTPTKVSSRDAFILESRLFKKGVWLHSVDYVLVEGTYALIISGTSFDSGWSKWSGAMKTSIGSFSLNN